MDSRLSSRSLAFNLIAQCLFCFPSAFGGTLRSCPALALRATCPSIAVTSPFRGAYVPHAPVFPGYQAFVLRAKIFDGFALRSVKSHHLLIQHLPHGRRDLPALIVGLHRAAACLERPGVAPGRRILLRAYSRVALCLSLDGSLTLPTDESGGFSVQRV